MTSFAQNTKDEICESAVKKDCCKASMLYGMLLFSSLHENGTVAHTTENENVVSLYERLLLEVVEGVCEIDYFAQGYRLSITDSETLASLAVRFSDLSSFNGDVFKCESCSKSFFKGAFLCGGTVNSPDSSNHLEIESPAELKIPCDLLSDIDIVFKKTRRGSRSVLYLKDSVAIEDFLKFIEARNAVFTFIDGNMFRELRNTINRRNNFETANLQKTIKAGSKYIKAIEKLKKKNNMSLLSEDLCETARLKLENPQLNLSDLAAMHDPPISKSGLYHRLEKIYEASKNI